MPFDFTFLFCINFNNYLSAGNAFDGESYHGTWLIVVTDTFDPNSTDGLINDSGLVGNVSLIVNADDYDSDCDGILE